MYKPICMYKHIHMYKLICMYKQFRMYKHICMYERIRMYWRICMYKNMCACVQAKGPLRSTPHGSEKQSISACKQCLFSVLICLEMDSFGPQASKSISDGIQAGSELHFSMRMASESANPETKLPREQYGDHFSTRISSESENPTTPAKERNMSIIDFNFSAGKNICTNRSV